MYMAIYRANSSLLVLYKSMSILYLQEVMKDLLYSHINHILIEMLHIIAHYSKFHALISFVFYHIWL